MSQTWLATGSSAVPISRLRRSRSQKLGKSGRILFPSGSNKNRAIVPRSDCRIGMTPTADRNKDAAESQEGCYREYPGFPAQVSHSRLMAPNVEGGARYLSFVLGSTVWV